MEKIFENAEFGKKYKTENGKIAKYITDATYSGVKAHYVLIDGTSDILLYDDYGNPVKCFIYNACTDQKRIIGRLCKDL